VNPFLVKPTGQKTSAPVAKETHTRPPKPLAEKQEAKPVQKQALDLEAAAPAMPVVRFCVALIVDLVS
jgi:hypothetical protein